ncbi:MAG TPA: hypothetical protein VML50_00040 [Anaeromyxobacter sp.]|nr:hypothetical protein [Anaeromyxobacter sp.]
MPPLYAQDPLDAIHLAGQHRWVEVALAVLAVACEPWALGLLGLALYSWLERGIAEVLKAFLPLAGCLAASAVVAVAARVLWAAPRLAGQGGGFPLLRQALPGGQLVAIWAFAAYTLLAYGRRAGSLVALLTAVIATRTLIGPHWAAAAGGGAAGGLLGTAAYAAALRLAPHGHLARSRLARRGETAGSAGEERPGSA